MPNKKSAVPEYIWYISLIVISITLVVGIVNITKKANKNIEPPSNLNVQFKVTIDPNKVVKIKTLDFIGDFDLNKDTKYLYLCCGGSCKNMMELFSATNSTDLFVRKVSGSVGLRSYNGLVFNEQTKSYYPLQCFKKGAVWELYYGNPSEQGYLLAQSEVKSDLE